MSNYTPDKLRGSELYMLLSGIGGTVSTRAINILMNPMGMEPIFTINDLFSISPQSLLRLKNMGPGTVSAIEAELRKRGRSLGDCVQSQVARIEANIPPLSLYSGMLIAKAVESAVAAERERCARIADNYTDYWPKQGVGWGDDPDEVAAKCIAAAIRDGKDRGCDPPQAKPSGICGKRHDGRPCGKPMGHLEPCDNLYHEPPQAETNSTEEI